MSIPEDITIKKLHEVLDTLLSEEPLNSDNILDIVLGLMIAIETFENVHGEQKKTIIIEVFNSYIAEKEDVSVELKELIKYILPKIIDTFVSIDKRQIKIKASKCLKITKKYFCC